MIAIKSIPANPASACNHVHMDAAAVFYGPARNACAVSATEIAVESNHPSHRHLYSACLAALLPQTGCATQHPFDVNTQNIRSAATGLFRGRRASHARLIGEMQGVAIRTAGLGFSPGSSSSVPSQRRNVACSYIIDCRSSSIAFPSREHPFLLLQYKSWRFISATSMRLCDQPYGAA